MGRGDRIGSHRMRKIGNKLGKQSKVCLITGGLRSGGGSTSRSGDRENAGARTGSGVMNVECKRKRSGSKTRIPNNQIESGGGTTDEHVKDPRRGGGGHERGTNVLLRKIRRDSVRSMTVSSIDSSDVMETGDGSGVRNNRNGGDRSVVTINISRGNLQFNFLKKNRRILTNGLEKGSPSAKIVMEDAGHVLIITKSERADMSRLGNKARQGENGGSRRGNSWNNWLRTLRRGTNRDGHDDSSGDLRLEEVSLSGSRFRVKFKRQ